MPERWTPVTTYRVDYDCPECGELMKFTGMVYAVSSPIYEHRCEECGHIEELRNQYPATSATVRQLPEEDETGDDLEWIEIPFGDGLRVGFWGRWVEDSPEEEPRTLLDRLVDARMESLINATAEAMAGELVKAVMESLRAGEPCPWCEKEETDR